MANWEDWLQQQGSDLLGKWSSKEFQQTPDAGVQGSLKLGQLGEGGYYLEGQAGATRVPQAASMSTETKVMIGVGALVLLFVVMRA